MKNMVNATEVMVHDERQHNNQILAQETLRAQVLYYSWSLQAMNYLRSTNGRLMDSRK